MAPGAAATLIGTGAEPHQGKYVQQDGVKGKARRMQQHRSTRKQQEATRGNASICFNSCGNGGRNHLAFRGNTAYPCLLGRVRANVPSSSHRLPAPDAAVHFSLSSSSSDNEHCDATKNRSGEVAQLGAPVTHTNAAFSEPWEAHHTTAQDHLSNFASTSFSNGLTDLHEFCNPPQPCELPPTLLLEPMKVELSKPGKPAVVTPVGSPSHQSATPRNPQYLNSVILGLPLSVMHRSLLASCNPHTPPAAQAVASRAPPGLSLTPSSPDRKSVV